MEVVFRVIPQAGKTLDTRYSKISQEPSSPVSPVEALSWAITLTKRTPSSLSPSRASLVSREWMTNTAFLSLQISPTELRRDSSPSMVSTRSLSRSAASAHNRSLSASASSSRACCASRHSARRSSILRSTLSIGFSLPSTLLSMGSDTAVTDVVRFVVLYMVLPLSTNAVEVEYCELRHNGVLRSWPHEKLHFKR